MKIDGNSASRTVGTNEGEITVVAPDLQARSPQFQMENSKKKQFVGFRLRSR